METMILIYKERSDWKGWIKTLVELLKDLGYDVEEKAFPVETTRNQIKKWLKDNEVIFLNKQYIITDSCCIITESKKTKGACVLINGSLDSMPRRLGGFGFGIDVSALLHMLDMAKKFGWR